MSEKSGEIPIEITLFGIGSLEAGIIRHLAPHTSDALLDKMPFVLRGRFSFGSKKYWTLPGVGVRKGVSPKASKSCKKGEIGYNAKTDELIVFLEEIQMPNKVNKIGTIHDNLKLILKARNGLNTKFSKI